MPLVSKAQQRWAFANQNASTREGKVAREFIQATPKKAYKTMPARVKKPEPKHYFGSLDGKY